MNELNRIASRIFHCPNCDRYVEKEICPSCSLPYSGEGLLCIVETALDVFSIEPYLPEGSHFHVLGGKLSPIKGVSPKNLGFEKLEKRVRLESGIREIFIATSSDAEGEATAHYTATLLKSQFPDLKITRMAFGVSIGRSLMTSDERSIQKSVASRISY